MRQGACLARLCQARVHIFGMVFAKMDRRTFLLRGVCGLGVFQTACGSLNPSLEALLNAGEAGASGPDGFYYSGLLGDYSSRYAVSIVNSGLSAQAKSIFDDLRANRVVRPYVPAPSAEQAEQAIALFGLARQRYASKKTLEIDETYDLFEHLLPLFRMFIDLSTVGMLPKGLGAISAPGADGYLTIAPGYSISIEQQGYCLDAGLPAPGSGEMLSLVQAASLIPEELQPLYKALLRKSAGNPAALNNLQRTLWTLRSAGAPYGLATTPGRETLEQMDKALPGGAQLFGNYHQREAAKNRLKDELGKLLNFNVNGRRISPLDFSDPNKSQEIFQSLLQQTLKTPVTGDIPKDNRHYQMLTPAVATFSTGAGTLKPRVTLANIGPLPYRFDISEWILQPARKAQRVAMLPAERNSISAAQFPRELGHEALQRLKGIKDKIDQTTLMEAARFVNGMVLKNVPKVKTLSDYAFRLLGGAPGAKRLVEVIPYVGNALCLYEAASGKNWVTGRDLNAFERTAAAFGTVPGGGLLKGVFKEKWINGLQMAFAGAGFATNQGVLVPDDIAAYAKTFTNPLQAPSNLIERRVQDGVLQSLVEMEANPNLNPEQKAMIRERVRDPSPFWQR